MIFKYIIKFYAILAFQKGIIYNFWTCRFNLMNFISLIDHLNHFNFTASFYTEPI